MPDRPKTSAASPALLLAAAVVALAWASSPWQAGYFALRRHAVHPVNDGLMTLFFLVVGLEIKRELVKGDLRDRRHAALPVAAALGGMIVPIVLYLAVARAAGAPGRGWAIPMATDIAFAVGVVGLAGPRVPPALRLFLLTLAVVDDIGAVAVVAMAYHAPWAHPAVGGAILGLLAPVGPGERLQPRLEPWSSLAVLPVFALVNAGVALNHGPFRAPHSLAVAAAVAVALVAGKALGITAGASVAVRIGLARLPATVSWPMVAGVAAVGGVGFTVALFVAGLAFGTGPLYDAAALGVFSASAVAGATGVVILRRATRRAPGR